MIRKLVIGYPCHEDNKEIKVIKDRVARASNTAIWLYSGIYCITKRAQRLLGDEIIYFTVDLKEPQGETKFTCSTIPSR